MKIRKHIWVIICFVLFFAVILMAAYMEPGVTPVTYKSFEFELKEGAMLNSDNEFDERYAGYVNLDKFKELVDKANIKNYGLSYDRPGLFKTDSITFKSTKSADVFFGDDALLLKYKELGIDVGEDRMSFTAHVETFDGVEYVYIPYHVLVSLARVANPE